MVSEKFKMRAIDGRKDSALRDAKHHPRDRDE